MEKNWRKYFDIEFIINKLLTMSKIIQHIGQLDKKLSKKDLEDLAREHAHQITSNEKYDVLKVYIEFKRYEVYFKTLIQEVKEDTLNKALAQGNLDFEYSSARVSLGKRRKFDYSTDEKWQNLENEIERLKAIKKEREAVMKSIEGEYREVLNEETGEIEKIFAPIAEYIDMLKVNL